MIQEFCIWFFGQSLWGLGFLALIFAVLAFPFVFCECLKYLIEGFEICKRLRTLEEKILEKEKL